MSLNWSVERMKNQEVLSTYIQPAFTSEDGKRDYPEQRKWLPLTEALVWLTMHTGINHVTEDNWQEFYYRIKMWEGSLGPSLTVYGTDKPRFITPLEVYMHIGLSTNASSLTRAQFVNKVFEIMERENKNQLNEVPGRYIANGLEHMTEAEYQKLWQDKDTYTLDEKLAKIPEQLKAD